MVFSKAGGLQLAGTRFMMFKVFKSTSVSPDFELKFVRYKWSQIPTFATTINAIFSATDGNHATLCCTKNRCRESLSCVNLTDLTLDSQTQDS